jgi:predicted alpha/beta hydrolase
MAVTPMMRFDAHQPRAQLLWVPALGVPARKYQPLGEALAALSISVQVHEWRGTGAHPARASRRDDWGYAEVLADDLLPELRTMATVAPGLPLLAGGHSLGAQFAGLAAARSEGAVRGLAVVATGVPHWKLYPQPFGLGVATFALAIPVLTHLLGHYPGETLGFAGREAARLMRDWARTVRRGHYDAPQGLGPGTEAALAALNIPVLGLRPTQDRLCPPASLDALLAKWGSGPKRHVSLDSAVLGVAADHFKWMRQPDAVVRHIADWAVARGLLNS